MHKSNIYLYIYYAILLAIFMSWTDPVAVPNHLLIILFLLAEFIPIFFWKQEWLPMVISVFLILSKIGVSNSYSPSDHFFYIFPMLIATVACRPKNLQIYNVPNCLLFLFLVVLISSLIMGRKDVSGLIAPNLLYYIFLLILVPYKNVSTASVHLFSWTLTITSSLLSLQFLTSARSIYAIDYGVGIERIELHDPNYFGCILAMGVVAAIIELLRKDKINIIEKVFLLASILFNVIVIFLNASRGSLVALSGFVMVIIFFSNTKKVYKLLSLAFIVAFLVVIYNSGIMDLLQLRIESNSDDITNNRTEIWRIKLSVFFAEGNILKWIFGFGYDAGRHIGYNHNPAFHNDFIAYLVNYGIIGLILFCHFMTYPYRMANKNKITIAAASVFLVLVSCSLEPFTIGFYANFAFWLYILFLSQLDEILMTNGK